MGARVCVLLSRVCQLHMYGRRVCARATGVRTERSERPLYGERASSGHGPCVSLDRQVTRTSSRTCSGCGHVTGIVGHASRDRCDYPPRAKSAKVRIANANINRATRFSPPSHPPISVHDAPSFRRVSAESPIAVSYRCAGNFELPSHGTARAIQDSIRTYHLRSVQRFKRARSHPPPSGSTRPHGRDSRSAAGRLSAPAGSTLSHSGGALT